MIFLLYLHLKCEAENLFRVGNIYKTKLSIVGKDENKEIEIIFGIIKNLTKKTIN